MKKQLLKTLFQISLILFSTQIWATTLPFNFVNKNSIYLRDVHLNNPVIIPQGARIDINNDFLLRTFGTATPTQDQVQRLLLNPEDTTAGRIQPEAFTSGNKKSFDYFFPVTITTNDGQVRTGKVALNAYVREGDIDLSRVDGADPRAFQSASTTEQLEGLRAFNAGTEGSCQACAAASIPAAFRTLSDTARGLETATVSTNNQLWNKYAEYARQFNRENPNISRARAGYYKRLYIRGLVDRYGAREAGQIIMALTSFAEAPYRNSQAAQIAEMAAVMRVIENRAANRFRTTSRTLRDIGVAENADLILTNSLADWQFSAWNDRDNNLLRMITFNPETNDTATKRKMMMAFESKNAMNTGRVQFLGRLNDPRMMHYHANYVNPNWDTASARISAPTVRVDNTNVDISRQRGARHIFYVGIR